MSFEIAPASVSFRASGAQEGPWTVTVGATTYPPFSAADLADGFHALAGPTISLASGVDGNTSGDVLAATSGLYATPSADGEPALTGQWEWNGVPIIGATAATHTVRAEDVNMGLAYVETVVTANPAAPYVSRGVFRATPPVLKFTRGSGTYWRSQTYNGAGPQTQMTVALRGDLTRDSTTARMIFETAPSAGLLVPAVSPYALRWSIKVRDSLNVAQTTHNVETTTGTSTSALNRFAVVCAFDMDGIGGSGQPRSRMYGYIDFGSGWTLVDRAISNPSLGGTPPYNIELSRTNNAVTLGATHDGASPMTDGALHQFLALYSVAMLPSAVFSDFFEGPAEDCRPKIVEGSSGVVASATPRILMNGVRSFVADPPQNFGTGGAITRFGAAPTVSLP